MTQTGTSFSRGHPVAVGTAVKDARRARGAGVMELRVILDFDLPQQETGPVGRTGKEKQVPHHRLMAHMPAISHCRGTGLRV